MAPSASPVLQDVITAITPADRGLYQSFFARDQRPACYANSWAYITQACRGFGLGLKYHHHDLLLSVGRHREHFVVVRPLGRIDERFPELLYRLRETSGKPVFIKKLFPNQAAELRILGDCSEAVFRTQSRGEVRPGRYPWDSTAYADDDTYPELILDVNLILQRRLRPSQWFSRYQTVGGKSMELPSLRKFQRAYQQFRSQVNRFVRSGIRCRLIDYQPCMAGEVRGFLQDYFGPSRRRDVEAYENMLTHLPLGDNGQTYFSFVAYIAGEPVGFFFGERLDLHSAGYYAGLASRKFSGLLSYLESELFQRLQEAGIFRLNAGGAEIKTLHNFKCRLAPVEERTMPMLVYGAPE